jgi:hypothetical protein
MVLKGTRLAKRDARQYYIYLYNVKEFYVEVFYDVNTDIIEFMQAFAGSGGLLPYIGEISIVSGS